MAHPSRFLADAAFAAIAAPAAAQHVVPEAILYDQPHHQDYFFRSGRGLPGDVPALGSIARPAAMPFTGVGGDIRPNAEARA